MNDYKDRKPSWKQNKTPMEPRLCPLEVEVRGNDVEQALKVLKNKLAKDGIMAELKVRRCFEKKSDKARRKHRESIKKARKSRGKPKPRVVKE